jgi:N-acetylglucosamine kinase-like BadF-type ATPase
MRFVVGLDGGGSKLLCVLADETGRFVGASLAGPTNSNFNTPEEIDYAISSAISEVLTQHGVDKGDVVIVYGAMPVETQLVQSVIVRNLHEGVTVHVCQEFVLSLFGAIQEDFGALVQAGTGSFTTIRTRFVEKTVDAWGTIIGDEGSGYDIGRKVLIACAKMEDGRGEFTSLLGQVLLHWSQEDMRHLAEWIYRTPVGNQRTLIASLCPIVGKCAAEGDQVSIDIIDYAAEMLGLQAVTALKQPGVDDGFPVTVAGGVWKTSPRLFNGFAMQVTRKFPQVSILPPLFEPVIGGVLLGLRDIAFPVKERIADLRQNYASFALAPELWFWCNN